MVSPNLVCLTSECVLQILVGEDAISLQVIATVYDHILPK